jgi:hypothetical protein
MLTKVRGLRVSFSIRDVENVAHVTDGSLFCRSSGTGLEKKDVYHF